MLHVHHPRPHRPVGLGAGRRSGFTLVELLIATAATLAILLLCTQLLSSAQLSIHKMRGSAEVDQKLRSSTELLRRDLSHLYLGSGKKLGSIFTAGGGGPPDEGYFRYEENSPAGPVVPTNSTTIVNVGLRQGVDSFGQPVETDHDDVLQFTVRLSGARPEEIFYGRVPFPHATGSIAEFLDNKLAAGRFDQPNNGIYTSRLAEVAYFLRPDRPYTQAEINNPGTATVPGAPAPATPATYTLYRVQRVILENEYADFINQNALVADRAAQAAIGNFYDLSTRADYFAPGARFQFNKASDLTHPRNRFGLYPTALPTTIGSDTNFAGTVRWVPLAGFGTLDTLNSSTMVGGVAVNRRGVHDVFDLANGADRAANERWFGRPVIREMKDSANAYRDAYIATLTSGATLTSNTGAGKTSFINEMTAGNPSLAAGTDILLTNVLSFNVGIYDDDAEYVSSETRPSRWPHNVPNYDTDGLLGTHPVNPTAMNSLTGPMPDPNFNLWDGPEFIDLGCRGVDEGPGDETQNWTYSPSATAPVDWGAHTPARWRTRGHRARQNPALHTSPEISQDDPRATYDTWWNPSVEAGFGPSWTQSVQDANDPNFSTRGQIPPYARPIKGLQIKIRILEPRSNTVREATIVQRFAP